MMLDVYYPTHTLMISHRPLYTRSIHTLAVFGMDTMTSHKALTGQRWLRHRDHVVWHTSSVVPTGTRCMAEVLSQLLRTGLQVKLFILFKEAIITYLGLAVLDQQTAGPSADHESVCAVVDTDHHHHVFSSCSLQLYLWLCLWLWLCLRFKMLSFWFLVYQLVRWFCRLKSTSYLYGQFFRLIFQVKGMMQQSSKF